VKRLFTRSCVMKEHNFLSVLKKGLKGPVTVLACLWLILGCAASPQKAGAPSPMKVSLRGLSEDGPQSSAFRLGPGDEVRVTVWRQESLNKAFTVPPSGWVTFLLVGDLQISGLTPLELRDRIMQGLEKYMNDPQVSVEVTNFRSKRVYVLGEVRRPGVLYLGSPICAVEAISHSGDFTTNAKKTDVLLIRQGQKQQREVFRLDLESAVNDGMVDQNPMLESGDILYIPPTFLANLDRVFQHIAPILSTIVNLERGLIFYPDARDVLKGEDGARILVVP